MAKETKRAAGDDAARAATREKTREKRAARRAERQARGESEQPKAQRDPERRAAAQERRAAKSAAGGASAGASASAAASADDTAAGAAKGERGAKGGRRARREREGKAEGGAKAGRAAQGERGSARAADPAGKRGTRAERIAARAARGSSSSPTGEGASAGISLSDGLYERMAHAAVLASAAHFAGHLDGLKSLGDAAAERIVANLSAAREMDLFGKDGISEPDFVNLSVLTELLQPRLYVESGPARAGNLFAAFCAGVPEIVAVSARADTPPFADEGRVTYAGASDFAAHDFGSVPELALLHFDDGVATPKRIAEAAEGGFRTLVFDGAHGLTGLTRVGADSVPTIAMVMAADSFQPDDIISWSMRRRAVEVRVTPEMIEAMRAARERIAQVVPFPSLDDYIAAPPERRLTGASKAFVVLR